MQYSLIAVCEKLGVKNCEKLGIEGTCDMSALNQVVPKQTMWTK